MKDKLEVGMYVRTKYGISQYKQHKVIGSEDIRGILCKDGSRVIFANIEDIIGKPSHNIIDLIEEKDFCEIEFYSERYKERVKRIFEVGYVARGKLSHINFENAHCQLDIINGEWSNHDKCLNPKIKSIVTKEQFSSIEYRLGDDK